MNPAYYPCPVCRSINHRKVGKPKEKLYECRRCSTRTHFGKIVRAGLTQDQWRAKTGKCRG